MNVHVKPATLKPDHRTNLSARAMLMALNISMWSARKHDRIVSNEVAKAKEANASAGRYNKALLPPDALKEIISAHAAARKEHFMRTLPWHDDGARILSAVGYFEYGAAMQPYRRNFEAAVEKFVTNYPRYVQAAARQLGKMYNPSDYPHQDDIHKKFKFRLRPQPFPDAQDFRADIPQSELENVRAEVRDSETEILRVARNDVFQRVLNVTQHMVDRLTKFVPATSEARPQNNFHSSMVENVRELANLLPSLNIGGDNDVTDLKTALEQIGRYDAEELKEDAALRKDTANDADKILQRVKSFLG